jgi:nucleoside-triphosphatase
MTGVPGCGKTTVIRKVVSALEIPASGFYTAEERSARGARTGFSIRTLDGRSATLAKVGLESQYRVGRYGVDLESVDHLAVESIKVKDGPHLIVIDEIGKMECFSSLFRQAVEAALESVNPVLGTIAVRGSDFIRKIRSRPDVSLMEVTRENRDRLTKILTERFLEMRADVEN